MDLRHLNSVDVSVLVSSCGPFISFICDFGKNWVLHRHCCLVPETDWRGIYPNDAPRLAAMLEPPVQGPFIVVRDFTARESPSSFSSVSGNGDSDTGNGDSHNNNPSKNNGNGLAYIFSELELAAEANPPYIIVDSLYADEVSKNIYRGNLCRVFSLMGSVAAAAMAIDLHTLPVAVPTLSMTVVTASFYGFCYMKDPAMRYKVMGRRWQADGFQLSPEHFIYTEQQAPLVMKAANSRFRKALRVLPVVLPVLSTGIVLWRFWKVLA